jgi:hypothetical protein
MAHANPIGITPGKREMPVAASPIHKASVRYYMRADAGHFDFTTSVYGGHAGQTDITRPGDLLLDPRRFESSNKEEKRSS